MFAESWAGLVFEVYVHVCTKHTRYGMCAHAVMLPSLTSSPSSQTTDAADQLLMKERSHLLSVKRSLEAQLRKVQLQLQVLNTTRARLAAIVQERSRVTDLLCHSMSSTVAVCHFSPRRGAAVGQRSKVSGPEEAVYSSPLTNKGSIVHML